uniref:Uncharacterized protein n=1 Tax=Cacopsylla melanoneura TaxID=428564 RepID=A0A8D9BU91_9HEMI
MFMKCIGWKRLTFVSNNAMCEQEKTKRASDRGQMGIKLKRKNLEENKKHKITICFPYHSSSIFQSLPIPWLSSFGSSSPISTHLLIPHFFPSPHPPYLSISSSPISSHLLIPHLFIPHFFPSLCFQICYF